MGTIQKSGYCYPNIFGRVMLDFLEDVLGRNGLNAIVKLANLDQLISNFPEDNLKKDLDFSDISAINQALQEIYGPRGGRGLALRVGRATFSEALKNFGAFAGVNENEFKILPLHVKLRMGVPVMAKIISHLSDQISSVDEQDDVFLYKLS